MVIFNTNLRLGMDWHVTRMLVLGSVDDLVDFSQRQLDQKKEAVPRVPCPKVLNHESYNVRPLDSSVDL